MKTQEDAYRQFAALDLLAPVQATSPITAATPSEIKNQKSPPLDRSITPSSAMHSSINPLIH